MGSGGGRTGRVTFVISGLVVGGAERVLTALANAMAATGREVAIVTLDGGAAAPYFPVDRRIDLQHLGVAGISPNPLVAIINNLRRLRAVRTALARTRPDAVVSFMDRTNVLTLLATLGRPWPVVVADRTAADPSSGRIWRLLRRVVYRRARAIVVQTHASANAMPADLRRLAVVIPNPVLVTPEGRPVPQSAGGADATTINGRAEAADLPPVVAVGRLVPQKGYDLLLRAFSLVARQLPGAQLEIWGDGPERERMILEIEQLGLSGRVLLAGETRNPEAAIRRSALLVLSSRVEGFPNVLLEAMALGRPVVAFNCPYGPAEIVRDGVDGLLVASGDIEALAEAIEDLLASPEKRGQMGARAVEVRERFSLDAILFSWTALIDGRSADPAA